MKALLTLCLLSFASSTPFPIQRRESSQLQPRQARDNDYSCQSTTHPNPVVLLHGLGATKYEDLNVLEAHLQEKGYCTFSLTYGEYPLFPLVGGLKPIAESSIEIATFIKVVKARTGATKINLIGHSEGAFQSLYVPKFGGIASIVDRIVAIAPPTHGTSFANLYKLAYLFGDPSRKLVGLALQTVGCPACDDLGTDGKAVKRLNDGNPIVQPGNSVTIIVSKNDELVTPVPGASFVYENVARNIFVQDCYPQNSVGHAGEAYDHDVWELVIQGLEADPSIGSVCPESTA